jgi:SAM-dependent methyltransferase
LDLCSFVIRMNDQKAPDNVSASAQSEVYGEDYFHGRTSGYAPEGYALCHPDWSAWLDVLWKIRPGGVFIDAGCAYGHLVKAARERGYQAFGVDISRYALAQEPAARSWLARADASRLPLRSGQADIVTLFDVLEHVVDPAPCLEEARRVLKPDGILAGATPDPIFFTGVEPTHVSEKPPSFWIDALERLGLLTQFRFSHDPYNFQFVATPRDGSAVSSVRILQHDYFDAEAPDFVRISDTGTDLRAVPRSGWGALSAEGRKLEKSPASIYLLNPGPMPLTLDVSARVSHSPDFSTLRLRLNSHALCEVALDSEQTERTLEAQGVLLPAGGHHLFFDVYPGGPVTAVRSISLTARPATREELTDGLPFDLFQRYRLSSAIVRVLSPPDVLDVGGYLGDDNGHLAVSRDFLQPTGAGAPRVVVSDVRACDHPDYLRAEACRQPFPDQSFDAVLSLDVLEHLDPGRRFTFLEELDRLSRRFIVLGAPFASPEVEEAERRLAQSLMAARRFLKEHIELGLPPRALVEDFFSARGYTLRAFPNGYLPRWRYWQVLTQHYFSFDDYQVTRGLNIVYNRSCYRDDNCEPAYRTIYLVSKAPLSAAQTQALDALVSAAPQGATSCLEALAEQPAFLTAHDRVAQLLEERRKALTDAQFLINGRQRLIEILRRELDETPLWRFVARRLRGSK